MAGLNDDAQWIVLMGFVVSFAFFFLAYILSQSTVVGQTTAESVLEFPKGDIQDYRHTVGRFMVSGTGGQVMLDLSTLSLERRNAVVSSNIMCWDQPWLEPWDPACTQKKVRIFYDNGVTSYNETVVY
jgi:hypothetical protein